MEQNRRIPVKELEGKFRSKEDIYKRFIVDLQYFLPSKRMCPLGFIRDIISGKKMALKMSDVKETHVPNYRELAVKRVFPELGVNEHFMKYMPDYPEKMLPEKAYFYSVLNSLYPNGTENLLKACRKKRSIAMAEDKDEMVDATPEILEEINSLLLHPTTPGIGIHLLKAKAINKKKRTLPPIMEIDLQALKRPILKVRRLVRDPAAMPHNRIGNRNAQMEEEEKDEEDQE